LNEIQLGAWFQRFAISQRRGFRSRNLLEAMPRELRHPARASKLIEDAHSDRWLFVERLGRGKIKLHVEAQDSESNLAAKKQFLKLSHPTYYTRGWLAARLEANASRTMKALSKHLLSSYVSAMGVHAMAQLAAHLMKPLWNLQMAFLSTIHRLGAVETC